MQHKPILFHFLLVALIILSGCKGVSDTRSLKLAHGLDPTHPVSKAMEFMADRCEDISGGKLLIQTYPSGQLGSEQQCVELLQIGSLAITKVSAAVMESFTEEYKVLGVPYLFKSKQHSFDVLDGPIGEELLLSTEPFWIRGLCFYDAGARSFYTLDTPVNHPDDLSGLKIRVMRSITALETVKALGGSPTPISWGELYTALQSGVVDGAENNPPSFYLSRHYEVAKYYTLDEHTVLPDALLIGTHSWKKLSEEEQDWLKTAVDNSIVYQRKLWLEAENEALVAVKKAGVEVIYPDKALFSDKIQDSFEKYKKDPAFYQMIKEIQAIE